MPEPDEQRVREVAELARLRLEPEEIAALARDFDSILESFRSLQQVEVEHVAPMTGATDLCDVLREDRLEPGLDRESVLANAPEPRDGFFGVPRVLGGGEAVE